MRSYCIYDGHIIDIAVIYRVIDGKQINIKDKVELYRKLGREKKLFCPCGCANNVIIVAGPKNLRHQHFRLMTEGQKLTCTFAEESQLSINSKIMLKCWLDNLLQGENKEILYRVPISQVSKTQRAYEMTLFAPGINVGIIYARKDTNVVNEKLALIDKHVNTKILYVNDMLNEETGGQYPEFMYRFQEAQGFCFYLDMKEDTPYYEVIGKVSVYAEDYKGLWQCIPVCYGYLGDYSLDDKGELICMGASIREAVKERLAQFNAEQYEIAERERIEKEEAQRRLQEYYRRQEEIRIKREQELQEAEENRKRRLQEEHQRQIEEIAQRKEMERKEREHREEEYRINFPKILSLYTYMENVKTIVGIFDSDQSNGTVRKYEVRCNVKEVKIDKHRHCIKLIESMHKKIYLFIVEKGYEGIKQPGTGVAYAILDLQKIEDVVAYINKQYQCIGHKNNWCDLPDAECQHLINNAVCTYDGCCSYQK